MERPKAGLVRDEAHNGNASPKEKLVEIVLPPKH
jgi:hypothetical protein